MKVIYHGHEKRREKVTPVWEQIVKGYNDGMSVDEIRNKFKNPKTKRRYTRQWVYKILKKYDSK